jgi:hypothetical protein
VFSGVWPASVSEAGNVTDDPGSNPDQKYAWRRDRQIYKLEDQSNKFGLEQKIPISIEHILICCVRGDFKVTCIKYNCVCHSKGCGLLLTRVVTVSPL